MVAVRGAQGRGKTDIDPDASPSPIPPPDLPRTPHDDAQAAVRPSPDWSERPAVLVHGVLGQEIFYWNFLRRRLHGAGLKVEEIALPSLALGDLRHAADAFSDRLHRLVEDLDVAEVDVVAHSAGGLVARYHLQHHRDRPLIRRLVTLGTPHGGTRTAALLPEVGMIGQVRPESAFMQALNADPTPGPTFYTAVWTPYDGVVVPAESARLPLADNVENVLYSGITHWGYLFGPRVARHLALELRMGFQGGERSIERKDPVRL